MVARRLNSNVARRRSADASDLKRQVKRLALAEFTSIPGPLMSSTADREPPSTPIKLNSKSHRAFDIC